MPDHPNEPHLRSRLPLARLEDHDAFERRHIGPSSEEVEAMVSGLGYPSREALIDAVIPKAIRRKRPMGIGAPLAEAEALARLRAMARKNQVF